MMWEIRAVLGALAVAVVIPGTAKARSEVVYPGANGRIAFVGLGKTSTDLWVVDPDGKGASRLMRTRTSEADPAWSPRGDRLAFTRTIGQNTDIYVLDAAGEHRLTDHPSQDHSPTWSPDGSMLAFVSDRDGDPEIFRMNADGSGVVQLTTNSQADVEPAWSPLGDRIAFVREALRTIAPDGSGDTVVAEHARSPDWSPDGSRLVFEGFEDTIEQVSAATGGERTTLAGDGVFPLEDPAYSPDGAWLVITAAPAHNQLDPDLFLLNLASGRQRGLTRETMGEDAAWQPIPRPACTETGTQGADVLVGTPGPDVLCGRGGDDTLKGLAGDDVLIGGPGRDTAVFADAAGPVGVDLRLGGAVGSGFDRLVTIENASGSRFGDRIIGDRARNRFAGGGGADLLEGGGGDDELVGGPGSDRLRGGPGTDRCVAGPGGGSVRACEMTR